MKTPSADPRTREPDGPLVVRPIVRDAALAWLRRHRHLPVPKGGWLFGAAVHDGARLCAVAVVERPARLLQDGATACVSRLCTDHTRMAASMALGAVTRAALALGYRRVVSYTLLGESGVCYRGAGWRPTATRAAAKTWACRGRARRDAAQPGVKVRWETGPDALPRDPAVDALVRARVGLEDLPEYLHPAAAPDGAQT